MLLLSALKLNAALRLDALRSSESFVAIRGVQVRVDGCYLDALRCSQTVEIKDTVRVPCYRSNTSGSSGTFMPVLHARRDLALSTSALRVKEEERGHNT